MEIEERGPKEELGKPKWFMMPWEALEYVVRVFEYGAMPHKYKKPFTYRAGIPISELWSSAIRHLIEFHQGKDIDEESSCHSLALCAGNCLMMLAAIHKKKFDDRFKIVETKEKSDGDKD